MKKFLYLYGIYRFCFFIHKLIWEYIPDAVKFFYNEHTSKTEEKEQRKVGFGSSDSKGPMARIGF